MLNCSQQLSDQACKERHNNITIRDIHIKFTLSGVLILLIILTQKIKATVLQQQQVWEVPQINDLALNMLQHCIFMVSNSFFIAFGIPGNYLENITLNKSVYSLAHTKHPLIHLRPQNYYHYTVKNSVASKTR